MKKLFFMIFTMLLLAGCYSNSGVYENQPAASDNSQAIPSAPAQIAPTEPAQNTASVVSAPVQEVIEKEIKIKGFAFDPKTLTVNAGTTVTWTNEDSAPHNIQSDFFNSKTMSKGGSVSFKFDKAGTYSYICGIHPSMKGTVVVQ